jgi:hypothetical protein
MRPAPATRCCYARKVTLIDTRTRNPTAHIAVGAYQSPP